MWGPTVAAVSVVLDHAEDLGTVRQALDGLLQAAKLGAYHHVDEVGLPFHLPFRPLRVPSLPFSLCQLCPSKLGVLCPTLEQLMRSALPFCCLSGLSCWWLQCLLVNWACQAGSFVLQFGAATASCQSGSLMSRSSRYCSSSIQTDRRVFSLKSLKFPDVAETTRQ